ncbi:unnamed protein product [Symbiodinium necroappetens]|uniref:Uncharacterized protein n=1 Tax=Symbiodinium necroappetens TaxID=1628268 RepID=A0A812JQN6_9DINO|nr:unnamed protein product [Symbiodinium necroappetens]
MPEFGPGSEAVMLASSNPTLIADLPIEAHAIVGAFTVAGLVFWLWGRKFLKAGFVVFGLLAGAMAGYVATVGFGLTISPVFPMVVLGVIGLLFGWMAFRFAVAASMGTLLTIAAPLVVVPIVLGTVPENVSQGGPLSIQELLQDDVPIVNGELDTGTQKLIDTFTIPEEIEQAGEDVVNATDARVRDFLKQLFVELETEWLKLPVAHRVGMLVGGFLAFVTGFGLGMLMPKYAAGLLASSVGAGVWLPGVVWLLQAMTIDVRRVVPESTIVWVFLWLGLAVIGAFFQWRKGKRSADKGSSESTS